MVNKFSILVVLIILVTLYLVTKMQEDSMGNNTVTVSQNAKPIANNNIVAPESVAKTDTEDTSKNYHSHAFCGNNKDSFFQRYGKLDDLNLTEEMLNGLEKTIDDCEQWFLYLESLDDEARSLLVHSLDERKKLIEAFIDLRSFDPKTIAMANSEIQSNNPETGSFALNYLLNFDSELLQKIADEMNVQNVNFLRNSQYPSDIYRCLKGEDCSATSQVMTDICIIDESTCGLSYLEMVRNDITINQYDDIMRALQIIDHLINTGWFEQRNIVNPTDP